MRQPINLTALAEQAVWLADKIVSGNDYAKEAASVLRKLAAFAEEAYQVDLVNAYASGRKDERETWEPVLEALKRCIGSLGVVSPGGRTDPDIVFAEAAIASVEGKS